MRILTKAPAPHADRGGWLECAIIQTLRIYEARGIGCGEKVKEPLVDLGGGKTVRVKSSVDFVGGVYGIPFRIEAKLVHEPRLPRKNVKPHQIERLKTYERCGNLGALLVSFYKRESYLVTPDWWSSAMWSMENGQPRIMMAPSIPQRRFQALGKGCQRVAHGAHGSPLDIASAMLGLWAERNRPTPLMRAGMQVLARTQGVPR